MSGAEPDIDKGTETFFYGNTDYALAENGSLLSDYGAECVSILSINGDGADSGRIVCVWVEGISHDWSSPESFVFLLPANVVAVKDAYYPFAEGGSF